MMTTPIDKNINNNMSVSGQGILMTGISKSALRWIVASLSLILFVTIVCLSYSIGVGDAQNGAIPIIRADGSAVKVRPDNPGGRQYPHQDLTIYNSFRDDISNKDIHLKDNLEKPMESMPAVDVGTVNSQMNNNQIKNNMPSDDGVQLMTVSQTQSPSGAVMPEKQNSVTLTPNNTNLQSEEAIKKIVTASAPVPTKIEPAKAAVPVQQKPVTPPQVQAVKNGNAYLQIGAYRSESDALVGFTKAKSKFSQLSSAGHNIVKADLGTKGVYYRLRVGPFASKEQSLNVCSQLQAKGQACLYIPQ